MKIIYILVNSAYPDEIPDSAPFHPGLHCLPEYKIVGFLYTKGNKCSFEC